MEFKNIPFLLLRLRIWSQFIRLIVLVGIVEGYMILDLHSNSTSYMNNQILKWSHPAPAILKCDNTPLITTNGTLEKKYDSLPSHHSVFITINLWFINDSYNPNDKIDVIVLDSSNTVFENYTMILVTSPTPWPNITCAAESQRSLKDVVLNIQSNHHIGNALKLKFNIQSSLFVGIRNIKILLSNQTIPTSSFCINSPDPNFLSPQCPCPLKQYEFSPGSCDQCHSTCATCFNSLPTGCLSCTPGYSFNGTICIPCHSSCETCFGTSQYECLTCHDGGHFHLTTHSCHSSPCLSPLSPIPFENYFVCTCQDGNYCYDRNSTCIGSCPFPAFKPISRFYRQFCEFNCSMGLYFYTNGSCISECEPYFIRRDEGGYIYCDYPCSTAKHLYWNGTCSNCTFPLVPNNSTGYRYCTFPCQSNEFLYWNGSCIQTCNFPLQKDISELGKTYCHYPCNTSQFLYWNGTCINVCEYPFVIMEEAGRKFCQLPCPPSLYLFDNGSCIDSCTTPLVKKMIETVKICKRPCPGAQYYYPDDKICRNFCSNPYKINTTDLSISCELPVSVEEKKGVQQVNSIGDNAGDATQGVVSISVVASTDPGGSSASMLTKMLQYTRYFNITYSASLELMFRTKNLTSSFIPFLPPIYYNNVKESITKYKVPPVFAKYNLHSSFLINFWEGFVSLGIVIGLWILIRVFEVIGSKCTLLYRISKIVRMATQNYIFAQFYSIYSDILLFFAIEIKSTELDSPMLLTSFISSIILVGTGLVVMYIHLKIIMEYQTLRAEIIERRQSQVNIPITSKIEDNQAKKALDKFNKDYEGMKVLFLNFKDASLLHQSFFLFLNIRNTIFALMIGFLFDYPIIQVSILTCFTIITILYLLVKRPFNTLVNFLQQLFVEIILLIVNICLINLAALDFKKSNLAEKRETVSQIIIICNLVIGFVAPVFGVAKGIIAIYNYIKLRRAKGRLQKTKAFESKQQIKAEDVINRSQSGLVENKSGKPGKKGPSKNVLLSITDYGDLSNFKTIKPLKSKSSNFNAFQRAIVMKTIKETQKQENAKKKDQLNESSFIRNELNLGKTSFIKTGLDSSFSQLIMKQDNLEKQGFSGKDTFDESTQGLKR